MNVDSSANGNADLAAGVTVDVVAGFTPDVAADVMAADADIAAQPTAAVVHGAAARQRSLGVFRYREFRLLWAGQFISNLGDSFGYLALIWMVKELTGSGLLMGTVMAVASLALVLLGPPAGTLVDRWQKRQVMLATDVIRFFLVALMAAAYAFRWISVPLILAYAALSGMASAFFQPALQGSLVSLVEREELTQANSFSALTRQIAMMAGPVLAGITVATAGISVAFSLDALSFLVSAASLACMRYRTATAMAPATGGPGGRTPALRQVRQQLAEGLATIVGHSVLRWVIPIAVIANFLFGPIPVLLPLLAGMISPNGPAAFGYLNGAMGAGMLAGSLAMATLGQKWRKGWAAIAGMAGIGLAMAAVGAAPAVPAGAAAMFATGLFNMLVNIPIMTFLQESVPPERQGRVFAVLMAGAGAAQPLSMAAGGWLGDTLGVRTVFVLSGILLMPVVAAMVAVRPLREAR